MKARVFLLVIHIGEVVKQCVMGIHPKSLQVAVNSLCPKIVFQADAIVRENLPHLLA